jgi:predicted nucleic acid binding AN1-type Zn finger protein
MTEKKVRCNVCRKKLTLFTEFDCKCFKKFCNLHRLPIDHNCSINIKKIHKNNLKKINPKIEKKKIDKI